MRANLTGRGDSPHAIAASLDGGLEIVGGEGRIDNGLLDATGAGLGDLLAVWREQDSDMNLNCAVARFGAEKGVLTSRAILADTHVGVVRRHRRASTSARRKSTCGSPPEAQADQPDEPGRAGAPVRPAARPSIRPDPIGAAKATAFVVGAAINPLVAVGALVVASETQDQNPCVAALAKARQEGTGKVEGDNGGVGGFFNKMGDSIDRALGRPATAVAVAVAVTAAAPTMAAPTATASSTATRTDSLGIAIGDRCAAFSNSTPTRPRPRTTTSTP
ncbi:MAG: hypothetical protein U5L06_11670 [Rhodovibrio sp.]|nr:hypothetical protein [Rhodovibrio sp.]